MDITILGIESSCDDTSAAVLRDNRLLSNVIASPAVHVLSLINNSEPPRHEAMW